LVGDGFGLGDLLLDFDGDGLGECDGLGLLLAVGLVALVLLDGLVEFVGLREALLVGLGVPDGLALVLGLVDGLPLAGMASKFADSTASALCPHGDAIGNEEEARTGAAVKPVARNDPAARQIAMRPVRMIPSGTGQLPSTGQR